MEAQCCKCENPACVVMAPSRGYAIFSPGAFCKEHGDAWLARNRDLAPLCYPIEHVAYFDTDSIFVH